MCFILGTLKKGERSRLSFQGAGSDLSSKHLSLPTARCLALGQCRFSVNDLT